MAGRAVHVNRSLSQRMAPTPTCSARCSAAVGTAPARPGGVVQLRAGAGSLLCRQTSQRAARQTWRRAGCTVDARLRPGRQQIQRRHREERMLGNREVLDYLLSIGVERIQCLMVYGKAAEALLLKYGPEEDLTLEDVQASVVFLKEMGLTETQLPKVIQDHPSILSYDVEEHLRPIYDYLTSLGISPEQITKAIVRRPSLLGLHVEHSLKKMVSYLLDNGTPKEKVIEYVLTTL